MPDQKALPRQEHKKHHTPEPRDGWQGLSCGINVNAVFLQLQNSV
jgi:hypothetical protein